MTAATPNTEPTFDEHEIIYLQPWCNGCEHHCSSGEGRQWCQDDVFDDCEECGKKSVAFVRAK